ncbi:MAG: aminopeptidase [Magnetococcales bacterium]|nr:aminopeptidase [Magnetococcales bacterium]
MKAWERRGRGWLGLACGVAVTLAGCSTPHYYWQSVKGQWRLWQAMEPVEEVLRRPNLDALTRKRLLLAEEVRGFALEALHLPDHGGYRDYADLGRSWVVWVVNAAPAYSLEPLQWCFPIVGCLGYIGFFSREEGEQLARELAAQGYDVVAGGVGAYSTLGWFRDPLLNTFFERGEVGLAQLLFHEMAHGLLYVEDDTPFNEAFAETVAREGVRRWLEKRGEREALRRYHDHLIREGEVLQLMTGLREELGRLYEQPLSDPEKRENKHRVLEEGRERYRRLKAGWGGKGEWDGWFGPELNNARLANVATYHRLIPAFLTLLHNHEGRLDGFYQAARQLGEQPLPMRRQRLEELLDQAGEKGERADDGEHR